MLNKSDFIKAIEYLIAVYPEMENTFNKQTTQSVWYELLSDIDGRSLMLAIKTYATTEKFAPKPSQIREMAIRNVTIDKDWTEGWSLVLRSVGRFGIYREREALDWIASYDSIAAESIRRMGYKGLCQTEDQMSYRANFRQAYINQQNNESFYKRLPSETRKEIMDRKYEAKKEILAIENCNTERALEFLNCIGE